MGSFRGGDFLDKYFKIELRPQKNFGDTWENFNDEKKIWGAGCTPKAHFRPHEIRKSAIFGRKSVFFDSKEAPTPQNEVGTMKIFLEAHLQLFGAGRKVFDYPAPRRPIFGDAEISTKIDFWSKIGIFAFLWAWCTKKG